MKGEVKFVYFLFSVSYSRLYCKPRHMFRISWRSRKLPLDFSWEDCLYIYLCVCVCVCVFSYNGPAVQCVSVLCACVLQFRHFSHTSRAVYNISPDLSVRACLYFVIEAPLPTVELLTCFKLHAHVWVCVHVSAHLCVAVCSSGGEDCFLKSSGPVDSASAPCQAQELLYVWVKSCRPGEQSEVWNREWVCLSDSTARLLLRRQISKAPTSSLVLFRKTINCRHLKSTI